MSRWHPWRHLREHYPDVNVDTHSALPQGVMGEWDVECCIALHRGMSQVQRRCALTHEIIHLERGWAPRTRDEARVEEATVIALTALRLITLEDLVDTIRWNGGRPDCRDLNVLPSVLTTRVRLLEPWEQAYIDAQLGGRAA